MLGDLAAFGGLFLAAFVAATILPLQSEAVLVGLLLAGTHSPAALVLVATIGNVLGSAVNWLLGCGIDRFRDRKWFPAKPAALDRAAARYHRYGRWSLLLSWAPVIGDPLTVMAGVLREPLWSFLAIVTIAKAGRYLALAAATLGL
ncbi:DedA family protein [Mesorhizobium sp. M1E.F.Ca.ET.045.02.1.1]|uniref:YqaA family protein n=1 Tax=unclassified Mesorhizobium TaxID=325217 RepID=UPI000F74F183|nr:MULTISPECIES: YqaA family protein [unclassified Mesorhizobium]AZO24681.1 DedA family protein [Mesorhizobium sp. M1E.F.Ca.ET.045.02.1.1]RUW16959.1 DedA family protein [Mesorhizobium sp. M1E.F.Ca.ET.041.01.1.1]RUW77181.1 DedA family protein [Mesorhizobium sp. M1E.F.Ca.ET.063.01.1.1]RWD82186.1 MAG: DedA family protein [Mesorhizobium sp.]